MLATLRQKCYAGYLTTYTPASLVIENVAYLGNHIPIVVIPERAAQFLVVHAGFVLALAPHLGHHLGVVEFELAVVPDPLNHLAAVLVRQQLQQELPQLDLTVVTC